MRKSLPFIMPLFRSVIFIAGGLLLVSITGQSYDQAGRWWSVLCTLCNFLTIAVLLMVCRFEGIPYRHLISRQHNPAGFRFTLLIVVIMLLLGVGGMYVFGSLMYGYVPAMLIEPIPIWAAAVNVVLLPATVVFAEMPLYLGYCSNGIESVTGSKAFAALYTLFFYALQHSFIPLLPDGRYMLFRFLSFIPLMMLLGVLYGRKRNLIPLMTGHGVMDLATGLQILMTSIWPSVFEIMQSAQNIR